jgi:tetratricopeptide (TPR) repeat protein
MQRSTALFWLSVLFLPIAPGAFAAEVLTNDAVVSMVKAGLGDAIVLDKIKTSQGQFDLSTPGLVRLKESGVSDAVIKAMIEASAPAAPPPPAPVVADALARETANAIALYRQGKVVEAEAAFDKLLAERPGDDDLKIWKSLAMLEQARAMKDANRSGYKGLVNKAYGMLQPMGRRIPNNPDWNFAMAKAFWLNERPVWAGRTAKTALGVRADYVEAQLLLGDLAYDSDVEAMNSPSGGPQAQTVRLWAGAVARKEYEKALARRGISAALQAEALYKLGKVSADLEKKPDVARGYWERAVAADSGCRYGVMAQNRLGAAPKK